MPAVTQADLLNQLERAIDTTDNSSTRQEYQTNYRKAADVQDVLLNCALTDANQSRLSELTDRLTTIAQGKSKSTAFSS